MSNAPGEVIKMFMNNEVNKEVLKTTTEGSLNFPKVFLPNLHKN